MEESKWKYNGIPVEQEHIPVYATAFVYLITHVLPSGKEVLYAGKKQLTSTRKQKIGKRAIAAERASRADGKAKTVKRVAKSSGWESYWGSSKSLQDAKETGIGEWKRTIVKWCFSKKNATYEELKLICQLELIERESYNDNLLGSIFRVDCNKDLHDKVKKEREDKKKNNENIVGKAKNT